MTTSIFNCRNWYFTKYDARKKIFKGISKEAFEEARAKHFARQRSRDSREFAQATRAQRVRDILQIRRILRLL